MKIRTKLLAAGIAFLPFALAITAGTQIARHLTAHTSPRAIATGGLLIAGAAAGLLSMATASASYATDVLPGLVVLGIGVGMVFVSGCETARAGLAGLCQDLVGSGHVPLALGWGMPVIDSLATLFANSLFHHLAAGNGADAAIDASIRGLISAAEKVASFAGVHDAARPGPPPQGHVRLTAIVTDGLHFGQAPMEAFSNDPVAGPFLSEAIQLMRLLMDTGRAKTP